jgi:hypothetical protein
MVDAILQAPMHVITTMRSRMEHVIDRNEAGKVVGVRKVGMAPIQRPGMEYEFDLVCDMDWLHILTVSKSRCSAVADMVVDKPGPAFMAPVIEWLTSGVVQVTNPVYAPAEEPVTAPENLITLEMLCDAFDAETILEANEGKLPETDVEVLDLAKRLGVA